jgi:hypothetical protein
VKSPVAPRHVIGCPLDGEDLFEILLTHPSYREKHMTISRQPPKRVFFDTLY